MTTETTTEQRRALAHAAEQRQAVNRKLSTLQAQREALDLEFEAWTCLSHKLEEHP